MPGTRAEILARAMEWMAYMTAERRALWGVPEAEYALLGSLTLAAQTLMQRAMDKASRTHVITVQCQGAVKALKAKMRFFRDRYFKMPPLTEADWAALGFRKKAGRYSSRPAPEGTPAASLSYPGGPHAITIHLGPMEGAEEGDPESDYGYAVYAGIMPQGGATLEEAASDKHYLMRPPNSGQGLSHLRFTRRRKEKLVFDSEDAGKTVYVCCRYENRKGDEGQWGPVAQAVIP
jgi:hypothetical protein